MLNLKDEGREDYTNTRWAVATNEQLEPQMASPIENQAEEQKQSTDMPSILSKRAAGDAITAEKNLSQILAKSWRLECTRGNGRVIGIVLIPLALYAFAGGVNRAELASTVRNWAEFGLSFAPSLLGFLIAGFTIFASLSRPEMFKSMARMLRSEKEKPRLSQLKYNFFLFLNVFIYYTALVGLCMTVKFFAFSDGPVSKAVNLLPQSAALSMAHFLAQTGLVVLGTSLVFGLWLLKSFVYNIYHIVMMGVRWDLEGFKELD